MRLGYIGVGQMGGAIASALARKHDVLVFDPSAAAMQACVRQGASACTSVRELVRQRDLIFLCLPSFEHVAAVLDEGSDLVAAAAPGTLIVDQSTSPPLRTMEIARRLTDRSLQLVDRPVSGGPRGVQLGTALFTVGGTVEQFSKVRDVLSSITPNILHTGPVGSAMTIKVANNYLAAVQAVVTLQVVALAAKLDCDAGVTADALHLGSGSNYYIGRLLKEHVLAGNLQSGATIEVMRKDVAAAVELASIAGTPLAGSADLCALIESCVAEYGERAPYNAVALTVSSQGQLALGETVGGRVT